MQLNNKTNGRIIRDLFIDFRQNRVVYDKFETVITKDSQGQSYNKEFKVTQFQHVFSTIDLKAKFDNNETINKELVLNKLVEEKETGYTVDSIDLRNWIFEEKTYRVLINIEKSTIEKLKNVNFETLYNELELKHKEFIVFADSNKYVQMYVDALEPTEISVIQSFINDWIFIEKK